MIVTVVAVSAVVSAADTSVFSAVSAAFFVVAIGYIPPNHATAGEAVCATVLSEEAVSILTILV